jgi:tetratricopeptide (TPR) repeat protein
MEAAESSAVDAPAEVAGPPRVTDDSTRGRFDHWNWVDVPGSPLLTRLFEALKIECDSSIPSLDLNSSSPASALLSTLAADSDVETNGADEWIDFSTTAGSNDIVRYSQEVFQSSGKFSADSNSGRAELSFSEWSLREWDFSGAQPMEMTISSMYGISPFPTSSETSGNGTLCYGHLSPYARSQYLQVEETEWKCRLRKLKLLLGAENIKTFATMNELARVFEKQCKFRQAERLYRKVAISYQRTLGLKHVNTLSAYLDVINVLRLQGEFLQAKEIHQHIHKTIINAVNSDHWLALGSNGIKAIFLFYTGQFDEAEKLIRQIFQIELSVFGPRREDTLYNMQFLGEILTWCDKLIESEQLLRINIHLARELEGPFSRSFLYRLQRLAGVLLRQGRYDECKDLSITVAERLTTLAGPEHQDTLFSLYAVAVCERHQGNLAESERQFRSLLEKQIKHHGEESRYALIYLKELSIVLRSMGRHIEATALLERSYKGLTEKRGAFHLDTLSCCRELGYNYEKLGRYEDAIALLQRYIDSSRIPGEKPTKALLLTISELADIFQAAGRCTEALPLYEECFHEFLEIRGLSDGWTINTIDGLGLCYEGLRRYSDALDLYQRSIDKIRSLEGEGHPALVDISKWMIQLRETLAESAEEIDESQGDSDRTETYGVDKALIGEEHVSADRRLTERDAPLAEVDWMGELFDFDLLENHPSKRTDSDMDAQVDKT